MQQSTIRNFSAERGFRFIIGVGNNGEDVFFHITDPDIPKPDIAPGLCLATRSQASRSRVRQKRACGVTGPCQFQTSPALRPIARTRFRSSVSDAASCFARRRAVKRPIGGFRENRATAILTRFRHKRPLKTLKKINRLSSQIRKSTPPHPFSGNDEFQPSPSTFCGAAEFIGRVHSDIVALLVPINTALDEVRAGTPNRKLTKAAFLNLLARSNQRCSQCQSIRQGKIGSKETTPADASGAMKNLRRENREANCHWKGILCLCLKNPTLKTRSQWASLQQSSRLVQKRWRGASGFTTLIAQAYVQILQRMFYELGLACCFKKSVKI